MQFKNPINGHIVAKSSPGMLAFLFGGLYFLVSGIWVHAATWFLIAIAGFSALGDGGLLVMLAMSVFYAIKAEGIVRSHYLAKGWTEVDDSGGPGAPVEAGIKRKCPFCAEEIQAAAIKCKHCGSAVEPMTAPERELPLFERREKFISDIGAQPEGDGFRWRGDHYASFDALERAAKR